MAITNSMTLEGIVIGQVDYKESSKILKIFTREEGIISVMARGAKRPKSRMINLATLYTVAEFSLVQKNDFFYLSDGNILEANLQLRSDIKNIYSAQLCIEFVARSLLEGQVNSDLYDLLVKTIGYFDKIEEKNRLLSMFLIKYISMIGYRPRLASCVICGKIPKVKGFSMEYGGLVCLDHEISARYLKEEEYAYLLWLLYSIIDKVNELDIKVDEKEICKLLIEFAINKTEINRPIVLEAYARFMLN